MSNTIKNNLGDALQKFTFTDDDGEVIASFRLNPTDARLAARMQEVGKFFQKAISEFEKTTDLEDLIRFNDMVEEKICYVLGYDARQSLFGLLTATTLLPDGEFFAIKVVNAITEAFEPEVTKRKTRAEAIWKRTQKYTK